MNIPSSARELVAAVAILTAACSPDPAVEITREMGGGIKAHIHRIIDSYEGLPEGATATESTEQGLRKCDFRDANYTAHIQVQNRALEASRDLDSFKLSSSKLYGDGKALRVKWSEIKCNQTECVTSHSADEGVTNFPLNQTAQNQIALTGSEICDLVGIVARKKPNQVPGRNRHLPN